MNEISKLTHLCNVLDRLPHTFHFSIMSLQHQCVIVLHFPNGIFNAWRQPITRISRNNFYFGTDDSNFINSNEKVLCQKVLTTNKTFHQATILATPTQQNLEKTLKMEAKAGYSFHSCSKNSLQ